MVERRKKLLNNLCTALAYILNIRNMNSCNYAESTVDILNGRQTMK